MQRKCNRHLVCAVLATGWAVFAPVRSHGHGDVHGAIIALTKALEDKPGDTALLFERATMYAQFEHYTEALADLDRVQRLAPSNRLPLALRGSIYRRTGKLAEAKAELEAFLKEHPAHQQVKFEYCRTLADLKETKAAIRELDGLIAVSARPSPEAVAMRLRLTGTETVEGATEAVDWLSGFLTKHPLPVFEEEALRLELKLGRTVAALQRMDRMIAKAPRPESLCLRKADLLAASGDKAGAEASARAARAAIRKLPPHVRETKACTAMEDRVKGFVGE